MTRNDPDGDLQDQPTPETLRIATAARRAAENLDRNASNVFQVAGSSAAITALLQAATELEHLHARIERQSTALAEITPAQIEAGARALFEDDDASGEYTWAVMTEDDNSRADLWRADARRVLEAARGA